jgi:hypothetical protein
VDREVKDALKRGAELLKRGRVLDAQRHFYRAFDTSGKSPRVKLEAAELWRKAGWAALMVRQDPENGWTMFHNARAIYRSLAGRAAGPLWEVERGMAIAAGRMGEHEEALRHCEDAERHTRTGEGRPRWNPAIALSCLCSPE